MGIADRLVFDRAQAKALRGVVGRLFQAPMSNTRPSDCLLFEEQFAVVGAFQGARQRYLFWPRHGRDRRGREVRKWLGSWVKLLWRAYQRR